MEKVLRSFLLNEFEYSLTNLSLCVDYDDKSNIINFFQKKIFKEDVLNELKILLPQLSSEKFTVSNEVIRKTVTELLNLKSSDVEGKIKINVFYCIFEAFALNCKEEESLIVLQFFSFLCHILGINDLLENDINESVENLPSVNKSAFKIAFKGKSAVKSLHFKVKCK